VELAFLEIEELDGITKYKEERNDVGEMDEHDIAKEVMPDPEIIPSRTPSPSRGSLQELRANRHSHQTETPRHHRWSRRLGWPSSTTSTKLVLPATINGIGHKVSQLGTQTHTS